MGRLERGRGPQVRQSLASSLHPHPRKLLGDKPRGVQGCGLGGAAVSLPGAGGGLLRGAC